LSYWDTEYLNPEEEEEERERETEREREAGGFKHR